MQDYFHLSMKPDEIHAISSLGLAHLGDAVFELMVRSWLCLQGKVTSGTLHQGAVSYVSAAAQAQAAARLLPLLTEEESQIYRRGRNAKANSIPHHADRDTYQQATALEAVFGYLYATGACERLNQLFAAIMERR